MLSSDGWHSVDSNRELYNHLEVHSEIEAGVGYCSESDTEVSLTAWRRWGEAYSERLEGMFALGV